MSGWNQARWPRDQILLFRETLGDRIPDHHSVRLLAEILDQLDWSSWERHYAPVAGQPPIHPKIMAGAILYGLTHGIRSSRRLEWACGNAKYRSLSYDQHEALRRKVALRLKTESGKKAYAQPAHLAETPNGFIKEVLGLRQFLLRGLDKVPTEWLWACTAFNISKLMIAMEKLRPDGSLEPL